MRTRACLSALDTTLYRLADRPASGHQIEAPYISSMAASIFSSHRSIAACQGVGSTYNVRVGRSASLTGPYLDKAGTPMTDGGGTLVISGTPSWKGPGHNSIVESAGQTYLVYHAYSVANGGSPYCEFPRCNGTVPDGHSFQPAGLQFHACRMATAPCGETPRPACRLRRGLYAPAPSRQEAATGEVRTRA